MLSASRYGCAMLKNENTIWENLITCKGEKESAFFGWGNSDYS
jgi:hypothetical protein